MTVRGLWQMLKGGQGSSSAVSSSTQSQSNGGTRTGEQVSSLQNFHRVSGGEQLHRLLEDHVLIVDLSRWIMEAKSIWAVKPFGPPSSFAQGGGGSSGAASSPERDFVLLTVFRKLRRLLLLGVKGVVGVLDSKWKPGGKHGGGPGMALTLSSKEDAPKSATLRMSPASLQINFEIKRLFNAFGFSVVEQECGEAEQVCAQVQKQFMRAVSQAAAASVKEVHEGSVDKKASAQKTGKSQQLVNQLPPLILIDSPDADCLLYGARILLKQLKPMENSDGPKPGCELVLMWGDALNQSKKNASLGGYNESLLRRLEAKSYEERGRKALEEEQERQEREKEGRINLKLDKHGGHAAIDLLTFRPSPEGNSAKKRKSLIAREDSFNKTPVSAISPGPSKGAVVKHLATPKKVALTKKIFTHIPLSSPEFGIKRKRIPQTPETRIPQRAASAGPLLGGGPSSSPGNKSAAHSSSWSKPAPLTPFQRLHARTFGSAAPAPKGSSSSSSTSRTKGILFEEMWNEVEETRSLETPPLSKSAFSVECSSPSLSSPLKKRKLDSTGAFDGVFDGASSQEYEVPVIEGTQFPSERAPAGDGGAGTREANLGVLEPPLEETAKERKLREKQEAKQEAKQRKAEEREKKRQEKLQEKQRLKEEKLAQKELKKKELKELMPTLSQWELIYIAVVSGSDFSEGVGGQGVRKGLMEIWEMRGAQEDGKMPLSKEILRHALIENWGWKKDAAMLSKVFDEYAEDLDLAEVFLRGGTALEGGVGGVLPAGNLAMPSSSKPDSNMLIVGPSTVGSSPPVVPPALKPVAPVTLPLEQAIDACFRFLTINVDEILKTLPQKQEQTKEQLKELLAEEYFRNQLRGKGVTYGTSSAEQGSARGTSDGVRDDGARSESKISEATSHHPFAASNPFSLKVPNIPLEMKKKVEHFEHWRCCVSFGTDGWVPVRKSLLLGVLSEPEAGVNGGLALGQLRAKKNELLMLGIPKKKDKPLSRQTSVTAGGTGVDNPSAVLLKTGGSAPSISPSDPASASSPAPAAPSAMKKAMKSKKEDPPKVDQRMLDEFFPGL